LCIKLSITKINLILGCLTVVLTVVISILAVHSARKCLLRSPTVLILPKLSKHLLEAAGVTLACFRRTNCILDDATLIFFALLAGLMRTLRVRGWWNDNLLANYLSLIFALSFTLLYRYLVVDVSEKTNQCKRGTRLIVMHTSYKDELNIVDHGHVARTLSSNTYVKIWDFIIALCILM